MTKLTHYTSFNDLKESPSAVAAEKPQSSQQHELKEFIALLKNHCIPQLPSRTNESNNPSKSGN
jgi:hypothetical protein